VVDGAATSEALLQPTTSPADLRDLRGAFAVVAWDGTRGLLARDQMGSRPLSSCTDGQILYAPSEVCARLCRVSEAVRKLWRDGPEGHERGRHAWALEVWRAFAAEMWLRSEAGRPAIGL
jgi:asparagine synthetase B (glutamine-hydrolysing)